MPNENMLFLCEGLLVSKAPHPCSPIIRTGSAQVSLGDKNSTEGQLGKYRHCATEPEFWKSMEGGSSSFSRPQQDQAAAASYWSSPQKWASHVPVCTDSALSIAQLHYICFSNSSVTAVLQLQWASDWEAL